MHYFKVPRLGSYLAIKLEFQSCLYEQALEAAVADWVEIKQKQKEQDEDKKAYNDRIEEEREEKFKDGEYY